MPRKLKTYITSQGFYDLAVAAPSMKAALEAWGASSNLFHQSFAKEAGDADVIAATMEAPGIVLRRPVGSNEPFSEHSSLPTIQSLSDTPDKLTSKPAKTDERKAAASFEQERSAGKSSGKRKRPLRRSYACAVRPRCQRRKLHYKTLRTSTRQSRLALKNIAPRSTNVPRLKKAGLANGGGYPSDDYEVGAPL